MRRGIESAVTPTRPTRLYDATHSTDYATPLDNGFDAQSFSDFSTGSKVQLNGYGCRFKGRSKMRPVLRRTKTGRDNFDVTYFSNSDDTGCFTCRRRRIKVKHLPTNV